MTFDEQVAYYKTHPPKCIEQFKAVAISAPDLPIDGHAGDNVNTFWSLCCSCGNESFRLHGYDFEVPDDETVFVSPLHAQCTSCAAKTLLLDIAQHGYDPVVVGGPGECLHGLDDEGGLPALCKCKRCVSDKFRLVTRYEYPADLFGDEFKEVEGRQQDGFTWTSVIGRCEACGFEDVFSEFECAQNQTPLSLCKTACTGGKGAWLHMRPTKKLFHKVVSSVFEICAVEGFREHSVYPEPGWDPANQAYSAEMIRDDVSRYVDEFDILYYPKDKAFYFRVTRTKNVFGFSSIASLPDDPGKWNDMRMRQPRQTFYLKAGNEWNPFTRRTGFLYKKRELQDVDATAEKIRLAFQKNSRCLFDALEGRYNGRLVTVTDMKPIRPAPA